MNLPIGYKLVMIMENVVRLSQEEKDDAEDQESSHHDDAQGSKS